MRIRTIPAIAKPGVILGCIGSPSILGVVVPLTLSEPFGIGVAVTSAAELDGAALVAFAEGSKVLLLPSDEDMDVASLNDDAGEEDVEAAVAPLEEVASRGSTTYR